MRSTLLAILALSAAAIVACGDSNPPAKTPDTTPAMTDAGGGSAGGSSSGDTSTAAADAGGASGGGSTAAASSGAAAPVSGFDALTMDKKTEVMMTKVVPNVGKEFKTFDGKKFEKFGCKTCHGDAKTKSKDDPKKVLPKLTLSNGGFEKLQKAKPAMVKFMSEKVVPAMADALGEKPFDPQTHQGFGCGGCHTVE